MGVYIKGMEMPFTCLNCDFHKCAGGVGDFCSLTKRRQFRFKNRPKDCPLIEVPEPHGRLIDADALNYTMLYKENWMSGTGVEAPAIWKKDIDNAPTIIEEEEGKT